MPRVAVAAFAKTGVYCDDCTPCITFCQSKLICEADGYSIVQVAIPFGWLIIKIEIGVYGQAEIIYQFPGKTGITVKSETIFLTQAVIYGLRGTDLQVGFAVLKIIKFQHERYF